MHLAAAAHLPSCALLAAARAASPFLTPHCPRPVTWPLLLLCYVHVEWLRNGCLSLVSSCGSRGASLRIGLVKASYIKWNEQSYYAFSARVNRYIHHLHMKASTCMCKRVMRAHVHVRASWQRVVLLRLYGGSAKVSGSVAAEVRCAQRDGLGAAAPGLAGCSCNAVSSGAQETPRKSTCCVSARSSAARRPLLGARRSSGTQGTGRTRSPGWKRPRARRVARRTREVRALPFAHSVTHYAVMFVCWLPRGGVVRR